MKILYITYEGFDTPNSANQMAETMINAFLDQGHIVHLIQSHRKGINPDIPKSLQTRENFFCDTVKRKVVDKTKFIKRYLNEFKYAFQAKRKWKKVQDVDLVYVQSNPTLLYTMLLLKLFKRKTPIVYSIYDVFPGHAYDIGVIKNKAIYNLLKFLQKPCYHIATEITVLSEDMKKTVVNQGAKAESVHVVPAWYDVKTTKEIKRTENRFLARYNIPIDKFYVQFAGTIGYVFNYKTVIELAKRLKEEKNIEIQIIGDGTVKSKFEEEAKLERLNNIQFYPLQPVELVPDVYSACDICVIPLKRGVIWGGVPSKAPILMACRRVIVNSVEKESEYAKMFVENDMGVSVDITDYDALATAVKMLYDSPETVNRMAENAYRFVRENYSSTKSISKLLEIFHRAVESKK